MRIEELLRERRQKGYEIAKTNKVILNGDKWLVPSQSTNKNYEVILRIDKSVCNCPGFVETQLKCKHIFAVEITLTNQINSGDPATTAETKKPSYPQDWKAYDQATTQQKTIFMKLLHELCQNLPDQPRDSGKGRPKMEMRDMVFASALKVYSTFSLRRFTVDMQEAKRLGYIAYAPDYSTVAKYMKSPEFIIAVKELIKLSALPLKAVEGSFSIDSSGISPSKYSRWFDHKWGKETDRKLFYKVHLVNGNATHIVTAAEVTSQYVGDPVMLEQLVAETKENFDVLEMTGDKAYSSRKNLEYIDSIGAVPFIPFKTNSMKTPKGSRIWRNMYNYFTYHQETFLQHYHRRSNVETVFHMIKSKFLGHVRSKAESACINEIYLKVLCHNICVLIQESFELGIETNFLDPSNPNDIKQ